MDFKAEIDNLKRRVGDLEGAVNVLSGRYGNIQPELRSLERQGLEGFDRVGIALDRLTARMDTMNTQVWGLRDDLPAIVEQVLTHRARHDDKVETPRRDGEGCD